MTQTPRYESSNEQERKRRVRIPFHKLFREIPASQATTKIAIIVTIRIDCHGPRFHTSYKCYYHWYYRYSCCKYRSPRYRRLFFKIYEGRRGCPTSYSWNLKFLKISSTIISRNKRLTILAFMINKIMLFYNISPIFNLINKTIKLSI